MKFTYRLTPVAPLFVAGRPISSLPLGSDGVRTIDLEPTDAAPLILSGALFPNPAAPALPSGSAADVPDYDYKGAVIRNGRSKTNRYTANRTLSVDDKACFVEMNSASALVVTLPNDWRENEGCEIVREGTGDVSWAAASGASIRLLPSTITHTKISERYGSFRARVISNTTGTNAVWEIKGLTA